jgi:glyoxylase-like metal-dependent hydrolase (beta-lactamase superfamily II)
MKIQRLSTVSNKFFSPKGEVVMVDPCLTNDPLWPLPEITPDRLREIDVVAITYGHFDHASGVNKIVQQNDKIFGVRGRDHDGSGNSRDGSCDESGEIGISCDRVAMEGEAGGSV